MYLAGGIRTEAVFQLLVFNLATYPAGRYIFSRVQIIIY